MNSTQIDKRLKNLESTVTARTGNNEIDPFELAKLSDKELTARTIAAMATLPSDDPLIPQLSEAIKALTTGTKKQEEPK